MILKEIKNYLKENGLETNLLENKGNFSCALIYKGGPAQKPGPRRKTSIYQIGIYCRGADFSLTLEKANSIYALLHYPGILKIIDTDKRVIFSSECMSLPSYSGTDKYMRHVFVFDVLIKSKNKE